MSSLTGPQRRVLDQLLHGASGRSRSKHIPDLQQMGYVDTQRHPTLKAWHEFGEYRYIPQIQIPQDWEIETWQGQLLMVGEGPEPNPFYDDSIEPRNSIKDCQFVFSIHAIMRFYRECLQAEQGWMDSNWTKSQDYDCDHHRHHGLMDHCERVQNDHYAKRKRYSVEHLHNKWRCPSVGLMFYNWAYALYRQLELSSRSNVSFKYSLQRNVAELDYFLAEPAYSNDIRMYFARITID